MENKINKKIYKPVDISPINKQNKASLIWYYKTDIAWVTLKTIGPEVDIKWK